MGKAIPKLNDKLTGMTFHASKLSVSFGSDLCPEKSAKSDDTKKQELEGPLNDILGYTEYQIVSYDLNRDARFCTFGAGAGIVLSDNFVMLMPGMTMKTATAAGWLI